MPLPSDSESWKTWNRRDTGYFGESGGHLHLIGVSSRPSMQFNVYEMDRDYSTWFVKFCVDLHKVPVAFPDMISFSSKNSPRDLTDLMFQMMCVVRCEAEEESFLVSYTSS